MYRLLSKLLVVCLAGSPLVTTTVMAGDNKVEKDQPARVAEEKQDVRHHAYLGVAVESLHAGFVAHLPESLIDGQGVLINHIVKDSPADKAGLKSHDILVRYGDQKLFSPEQLTKLIWADQPGRKIKVQYIHKGKLNESKVTLAENSQVQWNSWFGNPRSWWWSPSREQWRPVPPHHQKSAWDSFDSLTLKKLDDSRYYAELDYLNTEGKKEHREFEGTRDEIRQDVLAQKDLPANERNHLLRSLDMPRQDFEWRRFNSWSDQGQEFSWPLSTDTPWQELLNDF